MIAVNRAKPLAQQSRRFVLTKVGECLYRSASGVYYGVVKKDGKQRRKNLETDDRSLARQKLAEFRNQLCCPPPPAEEPAASIGNGTFYDLAVHWLEFIRTGLKPTSHARRVLAIKSLKPHFGDKLLRQITRMDCERWSIIRSQQVAAHSFNIEIETMSLLFRYAISHGLMTDNPASALKRRRVVKSPIVILTKDQFKTLVERMRSNDGKRDAQQSADLVEFLAYSGCRIAEARAVTWEHVNFTRKTLTITGGLSGTKNHEIRTIPLFPALEAFLLRYRATLDSEPDAKDKVIQIHEAKTAIRNACTKFNLPKILHHTMRHFFCSNAIEVGVDFKAIAGWLGHKDGGVLVATTYGHLRQEHSNEMAKKMTFDAGAGGPD